MRNSTRSPTPNSGHHSRHSSRTPTPTTGHRSHRTSRKQTPKQIDQKQSHSFLISDFDFDFIDYFLFFFLFFFLFAFLSVDYSNYDIRREDLQNIDYRVGLKRLYLIVELVFVAILSVKKYFHLNLAK